MAQRFLLERHYISHEYDRRLPNKVRAVGHLLEAAFEGPPPAPELDQLIARLPTRH